MGRRDRPPGTDRGADRTGAARGSSAWPLHRKIDAWLDTNASCAQSGAPTSKAALARALGRRRSTISNWYPPASSTPRADIGAALEALMGAPMSYLLDPSVPWPPPSKARRDLLQRLLCDWSEPELDALFAFCRLGRAELVSLAQRLHGVEHPTLCRD